MLVGILDSQIPVIADKEVTQITADRKSRTLDIVRTTSENQPYDAHLHRARHRSSAVRESAPETNRRRPRNATFSGLATRSRIGRCTCLHRFPAGTDEPVLLCRLMGWLR